MSATYICRCGEKKEPCVSCLNQTCNELRNQLKASEAECERLEELIEDLSNYTDFYSDRYDADTFSCGQSTQRCLNEELKRQKSKLNKGDEG